MKRIILVLGSVFILASYCAAQQDTTTTAKLQKIILKDGSEMIGTVESRDSGLIRFKTLSNIIMTIPKDQVKEVELLSGEIVAGEYRRVDPNRTRLLFAPTARALETGQGYFSTYQIFFPLLAVGVADYVTFTGAISLIPGASDQLVYLAPKVRAVHLNKFDLAGGVLYINSTGGGSEGVGILYGVGTTGQQTRPSLSVWAGVLQKVNLKTSRSYSWEENSGRRTALSLLQRIGFRRTPMSPLFPLEYGSLG